MDRPNNYRGYKYGSLPERGALAAAYVPLQNSAVPAYESDEALSQGTLFPGLDLPFMNIVNKQVKRTPLTELMAIDFVTDELELYLDTHSNDREAFAMLQSCFALRKEAHERYVRLYGPVQQSDMLGMDSYSWLNDPWPWEYREREE